MALKTLVICVDRDNDFGEKVGVAGPIIGEDANIKAAVDLSLEDPEDTDSNALFGAVKTARELGADVVTLTGDKNVGIVSDAKIAAQLDDILERYKPDAVVLVTDGAADEQILPLLQSRVKINAVKTIIVRQSKELEKAYFTIAQFWKDVEKDPGLAHLLFVIPGLILIMLAIGGAFNMLMHTMLFLLALVGSYLIIKGFGFEDEFFYRISEFLKSISFERVSILAYVLAVIVFVIGAGLGYQEFIKQMPEAISFTLDGLGKAYKVAMTVGYDGILNYIDIVLLAFVLLIIGRIIDEYSIERFLAIRGYVILLALIVLLTLTGKSGASYLMENSTFIDLLISIGISALFFAVVVEGTEIVFLEEIRARKKSIKDYANKKVFSVDGTELGKVTRVILNDWKFVGVKVKNRKIDKEDILSNTDRIVVQAAP